MSKLSKAEQSSAKALLDDLCLVKAWADKNIVAGGKPVPARQAYEELKGQLSRPMSQNTFAVSFSANARLGTLGSIKGMRPKGYVRVANGVEPMAATERAPELAGQKKLKRSVALKSDPPEPVNAVAAAPSLKPVQRPPTPEPDEPVNAVAAAPPRMKPVEPAPQVGPEPKREHRKSRTVSAGTVNALARAEAAPPSASAPDKRSFARHVWVGRKLFRVRGGFDRLYAVVFSVLRGRQTDDGEVVFDGKRFGGFDAGLFERIIYHTLNAWEESSDSEPVLDDGSGIPVELRIE